MKRKSDFKSVYASILPHTASELAEYLGEMTAQGRIFWGISSNVIFKRAETEDARYAVEFLDYESEHAKSPPHPTQNQIDLCNHADWRLEWTNWDCAIYKAIRKNAPSIVTDDTTLYESIKSA